MMPSMTRALAFLLVGSATAIPAAEPESSAGAIEIPVGETVYFELTDSTSDKISPAIRVANPHRDYGVVRATLEADAAGARTLRIRDGYDGALGFAMTAGCPPLNGQAIRRIIKPGVEVALQIPASTARVVLCKFEVMSKEAVDGGKANLDSLRRRAQSQ